MAVHGDSRDGVSLHRVWETWRARVPDAKALAARFGWSADALANMDAWEKLESRYFFPTLDQIKAAGLRLQGLSLQDGKPADHVEMIVHLFALQHNEQAMNDLVSSLAAQEAVDRPPDPPRSGGVGPRPRR